MSARDATHFIVKRALEKEGWKITHDPYYLKVGGVEFYIDLGVEIIIAAERDHQKIAAEVKSFLGASSISEMRDVLTAQFGVQMGELDWDGKNPQRQLRQAEQLPQALGRSARQS